MKYVLIAMAIAVTLSTTACMSASGEAKLLENYQGGSYCTRQIDNPAPEKFRITLFSRSEREKANDCENIYAGNAKLIRSCKIMRCDQSMQMGR